MAFLLWSACNSSTPAIKTAEPGRSVEVKRLAADCDAKAKVSFERGLFLLHNMMYMQARAVFAETLRKDPRCLVSEWGRAMTYFHPLWPGEPTPADLETGAAAVEHALGGELLPRERDYALAAQKYFQSWPERSHAERLKSWQAGQAELVVEYAEDIDALAFAGLAELSTADKGDAARKTELRVGQRLEVLLKENPGHPGVIHYLLHAYDNPVLAPRAVPAAKLYDKVAPNAPHALHMPSHIYVRLGEWKETIRWNIRSRDAALKQPLPDGSISRHVMHAVDYLTYGYLQQGADDLAAENLEYINPQGRYQPNSGPAAYAFAASPARFLLERRNWKKASDLVFPNIEYQWEKFAFAEAVARAAKGLGAARIQRLKVARDALDRLAVLEKEEKAAYWKKRIAIQRGVISAWVDFGQGQKEDALVKMREAAKLEALSGKHPVEPGHVVSAAEQLGELLLAVDKPMEALAAFEAGLIRSPLRFHLLAGALEAARRLNDAEKVNNYSTSLKAQVSKACAHPRCKAFSSTSP
jgi:hypothetical protein